MRKIPKLVLGQLCKDELDVMRKNALKGGAGYCICSACLCIGDESSQDGKDAGKTDCLGDCLLNGGDYESCYEGCEGC